MSKTKHAEHIEHGEPNCIACLRENNAEASRREIREIEVKQPLDHVISVRLDSEDFHMLIAHARANRVGITTMARMLIHQAAQQANTKG